MAVGKSFVQDLIKEQKDLRKKVIYSIIGYINEAPERKVEFYSSDDNIRLNINHPEYTTAIHVKLLEISMNPEYVVTTNLFSDLDIISEQNKLLIEMKHNKYVLHFNKNNKKLEAVSHFIQLTKKHRRKF